MVTQPLPAIVMGSHLTLLDGLFHLWTALAIRKLPSVNRGTSWPQVYLSTSNNLLAVKNSHKHCELIRLCRKVAVNQLSRIELLWFESLRLCCGCAALGAEAVALEALIHTWGPPPHCYEDQVSESRRHSPWHIVRLFAGVCKVTDCCYYFP